jgi:hypothetical protein
VSTAFLLAAASCLAWDGAAGNPRSGGSNAGNSAGGSNVYAGNPPGGSYGGLENGYNPAYAAAWAPFNGGRASPGGGGSGSGGGRQHRLTRLGEWGHHRPDGTPPESGNSGFSCDSCSFADSPPLDWGEAPPLGWGGAPDLGAPVVAPTGQTAPAPAAAGDKK